MENHWPLNRWSSRIFDRRRPAARELFLASLDRLRCALGNDDDRRQPVDGCAIDKLATEDSYDLGVSGNHAGSLSTPHFVSPRVVSDRAVCCATRVRQADDFLLCRVEP